MQTLFHRLSAAVIVLTVMAMSAAGSAFAAACPSGSNCADLGPFTAQLTDFRTSVAGRYRVASTTLRFTNHRPSPLILGYVVGSGIITDDQGNRYEIHTGYPNSVRGIGLVNASSYDPKFVLQPAEASDARFEFIWAPGRNIIGTVFSMSLSVREIEPLPGNQLRLGREHLLQFDSLTNGVRTAGPSAPASAPVAAEPAVDACAGAARCISPGPFTATVQQVIASTVSTYHLVRFNVRLQNTSAQPLILAYLEGSGTMVDNLGNRYVVDHRIKDRVMGIGLTNRLQADPQFALRPGESRTVSFEYARRVGRTQIGTGFAPDLVLQQLEVLPSRQIRPTRDFSLNFTDLSAGGIAGNGGDAINDVTQATRQITDGLRSLFKPHQ